MKQIIKEILINLENMKKNQKCLEEEIKEIHSKIKIFTDQPTPQQRKP